MHSETLEYEHPHFLQSLFANDLALLKQLEDAFHLKVTTRDAWVKLSGREEAVAAGTQVFQRLETLRRQNADITSSLFLFVIENVQEGHGEEHLEQLLSTQLLGSPRKPPIRAKTMGQLRYLHAMRDYDVVFGIGPAGTGKTYLAMAHALSLLKSKEINRIILTRPAVEAGEALGFLPGDMKDKIFPYLRPLYDALYDMLEPEEVEKYIDRGMIELAPLAYMRGRTLSRAYVILDEAQNTTCEQMYMFLTRIGLGARCAITGDPTQIDLKRGVSSGLKEAMVALANTEGISFNLMKRADVVRHPVVQRIIEAYENHREANPREERRNGRGAFDPKENRPVDLPLSSEEYRPGLGVTPVEPLDPVS